MGDIRLVPQDLITAGVTVTRTAIATANTYQVKNDGQVILNFRKTGAGVATITIVTPETRDGLAVADRTLSIPASTGDVAAGPFPQVTYNNSSGDFEFTTDDETGLTCAVFRRLG